MQKDLFSSYFYFTRRERTGLLVLVALVALFFILPMIVPSTAVTAGDGTDDVLSSIGPGADSLLREQSSLSRRASPPFPPGSGLTSAPYPGKGSYPAAGYRQGDLRKRDQYVYYRYPYPPVYRKNEKKYAGMATSRDIMAGKAAVSKIIVSEVIAVNKTDSAGLLPLPGIGPVLAGRIISFRDKLGGFYAVDQVGETYGLPDSTFQRIKGLLKVDKGEVRQIDLNSADQAALMHHPYIRGNLARLILEYRRQHGGFGEVTDLLKIAAITREVFDRISPYFKAGI